MDTKAMRKFLVKHYIEKDGASNLYDAIRDCLTDLLHIGNEEGINIDDRLDIAKEVFEEELNLEHDNKKERV